MQRDNFCFVYNKGFKNTEDTNKKVTVDFRT